LNIAQVAAQATKDLEGDNTGSGAPANGAPQPPPSGAPNSPNENPNE
jgi:hypothetical protein